MKAVVYHGAGNVSVDSVPDPEIEQPSDVILKVTRTAICGSDLHLFNGYVPTVEKGDIFGHEFMGEVVEVGKDVKKVKKGEKVLIPFPIGCGKCFFCKNNLWSLCDTTNRNHEIAEAMMGFSPAGIYGYSHMLGGYQGGQAEYVRVINADVNAFKVPNGIPDEKVLFLTDIFPTGYMAAENALKGVDIKTVAVFGCGPVGQFTIKSLQLLGAKRIIGIDLVPERLKMAEDNGAEVINLNEDKDVVEKLKDMTKRRGPDATIDAIGMESTGPGIGTMYDKAKQAVKLESDRPIALRYAIQACRKGGVVSIPGVFSGMVDKMPMGPAMNKALTFYMGQTHVHRYLDTLMELVLHGKIDPTFVITHRLPLEEAAHGYEIFRDKKDNCIKIVLIPPQAS
jgi:threonine dehydrogenase-like Zn-dependent dehydrogenase